MVPAPIVAGSTAVESLDGVRFESDTARPESPNSFSTDPTPTGCFRAAVVVCLTSNNGEDVTTLRQ